MKKFTAIILAASLGLNASMSLAGGPVVVEDVEVVVEKPASTIGILPILIGIVVICVLVCGSDDDDEPEPQPVG